MRAPKLLFDQIKHPTRRSIVNDNAIDDVLRLSALTSASKPSNSGMSTRPTTALKNRARREAQSIGLPVPETSPIPTAFYAAWNCSRRVRRKRPPNSFPGRAGSARPGKTYTLEAAPLAQPSAARYWALWAQVEKIKPGLSRTPRSRARPLVYPAVQTHTPKDHGDDAIGPDELKSLTPYPARHKPHPYVLTLPANDNARKSWRPS